MKHLFLLLLGILLSGCSSIGYYWQAMNGHAELLNKERPIAEVIQDQHTRAVVKEKLQQAQHIRLYASQVLHLPDNDSYSQYVDLQRPFALWNVIATPRYSIQAKQWCFLFVGCLSYRGYYEQHKADAYAESLRLQGYDVMVSGARAYSTLGWFADPLLNTMLYKDDARLAGIIFHELAHQQVYKKNNSAFNEAFAMAVEIEGVLKWLGSRHDLAAIKRYKNHLQHQLQFNQLLRRTRERLKAAYQQPSGDAEKAHAKQALFAELKREYQALKQQWKGDTSYDGWMTQDLNNAHLALVGTYFDYVPYFRKLLKDNNGDFARFYQLVEAMSPETLYDKAVLASK